MTKQTTSEMHLYMEVNSTKHRARVHCNQQIDAFNTIASKGSRTEIKPKGFAGLDSLDGALNKTKTRITRAEIVNSEISRRGSGFKTKTQFLMENNDRVTWNRANDVN